MVDCARSCQLIFALILLGGSGYLFWHFTGRPDVQDIKDAWNDFDVSDFTDVIADWTEDMDFDSFWDEDPFVGDNTTNNWKTDGTGGLSLVLLNALDDTWQAEFTNAVSDWENGDPDTLTLTVEKGEVDNSCKVVDGLMKVCNGNYQESGWLGINQIMLLGDEIVSSIAKMNEYYLNSADTYKRQYTMCHEIGHGFGLPHSDEQFGNTDLGNCLDYTNNPEANLHPDASLYDRLEGLYGVVGSGRRKLRSSKQIKSFSPELMKKYEIAMSDLNQVRMNVKHEETGWRRLRENSRGGHFARRLDKHYTLKVHMLYDHPDLN